MGSETGFAVKTLDNNTYEIVRPTESLNKGAGAVITKDELDAIQRKGIPCTFNPTAIQ